ncbi:MAG TPA: 1-deoxy-D-xylulose-5-phosphate reductoisomerase [Longimicrobiales bacterium]|nr:1-deoxy-D-xylulose-5-phosphate reductoisomerase [Longimicrobiales bacterium]
MRGVALLGSTGSIGASALNVLARHADEFRIVALAANRNAAELARQIERYAPDLAVLVDEDAAHANGPLHPCIRTGRAALIDAAAHPDADIVINAVVGAAGLEATLAALSAGKRLALANKESLVAGGLLVQEALRVGGGELIPVDSEHSAILQCICGAPERAVRRMILTASGGPFRSCALNELSAMTPEQALRHPTWDMGAKITVDSATLVNKALEVVEAHFLFNAPYDSIDVVVHPQSIIHSMVEFVDGSVLAQLGFPTMELPILYALSHPDRRSDNGVRAFDPVSAGSLTFEAVDARRFPAFTLGVAAGRAGGTAPAVFNAANEEAVAGFLAGAIPFTGIADIIARALDAHDPAPADTLDSVLAADRSAREIAGAALRNLC